MLDKELNNENKIPGCTRMTRPEEISALGQYLGRVRRVQEENTKIENSALDINGRTSIPEINSLEDRLYTLDKTGNSPSRLVHEEELLPENRGRNKPELRKDSERLDIGKGKVRDLRRGEIENIPGTLPLHIELPEDIERVKGVQEKLNSLSTTSDSVPSSSTAIDLSSLFKGVENLGGSRIELENLPTSSSQIPSSPTLSPNPLELGKKAEKIEGTKEKVEKLGNEKIDLPLNTPEIGSLPSNMKEKLGGEIKELTRLENKREELEGEKEIKSLPEDSERLRDNRKTLFNLPIEKENLPGRVGSIDLERGKEKRPEGDKPDPILSQSRAELRPGNKGENFDNSLEKTIKDLPGSDRIPEPNINGEAINVRGEIKEPELEIGSKNIPSKESIQEIQSLSSTSKSIEGDIPELENLPEDSKTLPSSTTSKSKIEDLEYGMEKIEGERKEPENLSTYREELKVGEDNKLSGHREDINPIPTEPDSLSTHIENLEPESEEVKGLSEYVEELQPPTTDIEELQEKLENIQKLEPTPEEIEGLSGYREDLQPIPEEVENLSDHREDIENWEDKVDGLVEELDPDNKVQGDIKEPEELSTYQETLQPIPEEVENLSDHREDIENWEDKVDELSGYREDLEVEEENKLSDYKENLEPEIEEVKNLSEYQDELNPKPEEVEKLSDIVDTLLVDENNKLSDTLISLDPKPEDVDDLENFLDSLEVDDEVSELSDIRKNLEGIEDIDKLEEDFEKLPDGERRNSRWEKLIEIDSDPEAFRELSEPMDEDLVKLIKEGRVNTGDVEELYDAVLGLPDGEERSERWRRLQEEESDPDGLLRKLALPNEEGYVERPQNIDPENRPSTPYEKLAKAGENGEDPEYVLKDINTSGNKEELTNISEHRGNDGRWRRLQEEESDPEGLLREASLPNENGYIERPGKEKEISIASGTNYISRPQNIDPENRPSTPYEKLAKAGENGEDPEYVLKDINTSGNKEELTNISEHRGNDGRWRRLQEEESDPEGLLREISLPNSEGYVERPEGEERSERWRRLQEEESDPEGLLREASLPNKDGYIERPDGEERNERWVRLLEIDNNPEEFSKLSKPIDEDLVNLLEGRKLNERNLPEKYELLLNLLNENALNTTEKEKDGTIKNPILRQSYTERLKALVTSIYNDGNLNYEKFEYYQQRIEELGYMIGADEFYSEIKNGYNNSIIPSYQKPKLDLATDGSSWLRSLAELILDIPGLDKIRGGRRELLLNEAIALVVAARELAQKLTKTEPWRLPGTGLGGTLGALANNVASGGLQGAMHDMSGVIAGAIGGGDKPNPYNPPREHTKGWDSNLSKRNTTQDNGSGTSDGGVKAWIKTALNNVWNSIKDFSGGWGDNQDYSFNGAYMQGEGIGITLKDLCVGTLPKDVETVDQLLSLLQRSPYISTPNKFTTTKGAGYVTSTLDSNAYWEIILEPYLSDDNGKISFLPAFHEINTKNFINHGIITHYNNWVPVVGFDLQKSKMNSKSIGLYDGEIAIPVNMEFTNEFRLTFVDDQYKSWKIFWETVADVSIFSSLPHDKDYYDKSSTTSGNAITEIKSSGGTNNSDITIIDHKTICPACYKNITWRCRIYVMTPQMSTIRKYDLLLVMKDMIEEYSGEIDSGGVGDLTINFSIVGENPQPTVALKAPILADEKTLDDKNFRNSCDISSSISSGVNGVLTLLGG